MTFNLELLLLIATIVTGAVCLYSIIINKKSMFGENDSRDSWFIDFSKSLFPVILVVLLLRSFIVEPFRIPSGSMYPNLQIGDFILVKKFAYALKVPVFYKLNLAKFDSPQRGDVIVFRYPEDVSIDYIKRVAAIPGDKITFINDKLHVNGIMIDHRTIGEFTGIGSGSRYTGYELTAETFANSTYNILLNPRVIGIEKDYPFKSVTVPEGHYFVMGDNRDNSSDSRFWGFVPEENIKGQAFYIWLNWDNGLRLERFGHVIK